MISKKRGTISKMKHMYNWKWEREKGENAAEYLK